MPRKGLRSFFFSSSKMISAPSPSFPQSPITSCPSSPLHSFSESMMEENLTNAEEIITKWDQNNTSYSKITSLFYDNRQEAREFLRSVKDLQHSMHTLASENSSSHKLIHAQKLMQTAMKRLEKEFYEILSANRDQLDPESISSRSSTATRSSNSDYEDEIGSDDEIQTAGDSIREVEHVSSFAMSDLRLITESMISSGYGMECVKIYKIIRKSIVDESLYRLGFEQLSYNQILKLNWETLEIKIKTWLKASQIAIKTLFFSERILCDHVFSSSNRIKESCFSEFTKEAAVNLFSFAESAAKTKKSPEKIFRILDLYNSITELWPEIESIFSYESTSAVRSQAISALIKLGDSVRVTLSDFETAIQKDSSKSSIPGGGIHPLTRYVMNFISFLSDYSINLSDIFADYPLQVQTPLPETLSFDGSPTADNPLSSISVRFSWLILVLVCKLDSKAELYKDVGLSYLFLANNLQYILSKVSSSDLQPLLGEDWISKHEQKLRQYVSNYERMAWTKVIQSLPENPTAEISLEAAKEVFRKFNSVFEEAYRMQSSWIVPDGKMKEEIKVSVAEKIVPVYRMFYMKYRVLLREERDLEGVVRFAPQDVGNYLSVLFSGTGVSGSVTSSHSDASR
ncbi:exocyst complex component EXO70H1-like [Tasmannia lanceolata]|uniref:exocyst complex component EXO70H1-like n=1 Tax=Tasmannia lanceolata TaxID=3420 RepID=UPI00406480EE